MIVVACISGEPACAQPQVADARFSTREACEGAVDDVTVAMTKKLATQPELKGKEVTFEVTCLSGTALRARLSDGVDA
jgi:hypothetical protein